MSSSTLQCLQCNKPINLTDLYSCDRCEEGPLCEEDMALHLAAHTAADKRLDSRAVDEAWERNR